MDIFQINLINILFRLSLAGVMAQQTDKKKYGKIDVVFGHQVVVTGDSQRDYVARYIEWKKKKDLDKTQNGNRRLIKPDVVKTNTSIYVVSSASKKNYLKYIQTNIREKPPNIGKKSATENIKQLKDSPAVRKVGNHEPDRDVEASPKIHNIQKQKNEMMATPEKPMLKPIGEILSSTQIDDIEGADIFFNNISPIQTQ